MRDCMQGNECKILKLYVYLSGCTITKNIIITVVLTSREFRQKQRLYTNKADKKERTIVQRSKCKFHALTTNRYGATSSFDDTYVFSLIDKLTYNGGAFGSSNLLNTLEESSNVNHGFKNPSSYNYEFGNLISDSGKGINRVSYTYNDLPLLIRSEKGLIQNYYTASGKKLRSIIADEERNTFTQKDYFQEFEYEDTKLSSVHHSEGRFSIERSDETVQEYWEWKITDHLGNTRVRFADIDGDGNIQVSESRTEVFQHLSSPNNTNPYIKFGIEERVETERTLVKPDEP